MNYLSKLTLLAAAAMALIAFAVPAAAQASESGWIIGGEPVGEESQSVDVSGNLTFTVGDGLYVMSCHQLEGEAQLGSGGSEVTALQLAHGNGCRSGEGEAHLYCTSAEALFGGGPLVSSESTMTMPNFFGLIISPPEDCYLGIEEFGVTGELEGTFDNESGCIEYNGGGNIVSALHDVKVTGQLCFTSSGGAVEFGESAEGPLWYLNGSKLGGKANAKSFVANTTWKFTSDPIELSCETVESSGQIWNASNGGRVGVDEVLLSEGGEWGGCDVSAGGTHICTREGESSISPMSMFSEGTNTLTASELAVHLRFSEGCPIGEEADLGGQLSGQFNNETGCIEYDEAGSLETAGNYAVLTSAQICPEVEGGGKLTLK